MPFHHPFQVKLAQLINLADDYQEHDANTANTGAGMDSDEPDPIITPPLYGRWPALTSRLLEERDGTPITPDDNWVHELNLDPRFRVAAGFGTSVVQTNQETYMDSAWDQIGDVLEANRRIRLAQFAREAGAIWYHRHLLPMHATSVERALTFTAPLHSRVMGSPTTVYYQMTQSVVPPILTSTVMRRTLRSRGRLMRSMAFTDAIRPDNLLDRVNRGEVHTAPPKVTPPGIPTVEDIADDLEPTDIPPIVVEILRRFPWWRIAIFIAIGLFVLLMLTVVCIPVSLVAIPFLIILYRRLAQWENELRPVDSLRGDEQTPDAVDRMPRNPNFTLQPATEGGTAPRPGGGSDSPDAVRFKLALKDTNALLVASTQVGLEPVRTQLNIPALTGTVISAINPDVTVPKRTLNSLYIPAWILAGLAESFIEAMAYPEIDLPMYKPLVDISADLFLPNIQLIEQNSITLVETNQRFIEAYMVGLNHEFARELLWREYPTDQRGSYFRQFWDASSYMNTDTSLTEDELREKLRDIPRLDHWSRNSDLGDHDNREVGGAEEEEVVLVIRGELLKKYPTAVIYAHRARWQMKDGEIDRTVERRLVELSPAQEENPPRDIVKTPLYKAQVAPDIYFFGFDLTAEEAKGETEAAPDDPGWFFVIKERPGEPRFGLDIDKQPTIQVWNDLSWDDVQPGLPGTSIPTNKTFNLIEPTGADSEKHPQWEDDQHVHWTPNTNAGELAYILYQVPVLVAVHAAEMLRPR